MKICIPLRDHITQDLRLGNFRGEGRWERNALEAVSKSPLVTDVYTLGYEWDRGSSVSDKYRGSMTPEHSENTTLLMFDWNLSHASAFRYKGIVTNIFGGPWDAQIEEVNKFHSEYGNKFMFSTVYPYFYKNSETLLHLSKFIPKEDIIFLPYPSIPESHYDDRFYNKSLLWCWRIIFMRTLINGVKNHYLDDISSDPCRGSAALLYWAMNKLKEDKSLTLSIMTGWEKDEAKDFVDNQILWIKEDINDYFWSAAPLKPYLDIRSRVTIEYGKDWSEVLNRYSSSKLLLNYNDRFGGAEAAMFGVPFIGSGPRGIFTECPEYLYTGSVQTAFDTLDRLFTDHAFYTKTALSYNRYAVEHYSHEVFCKCLHDILVERNMV